MSECNDIAGSDDVISLNYESQETFNEQSYRTKQLTNRIDKMHSLKDKINEIENTTEQLNGEENGDMQTDAQSNSLQIIDNIKKVIEQPPSSIDSQEMLTSTNPFIIRSPLPQSTLTIKSSSSDKDSLPINSSIDKENISENETISKQKSDINTSEHDASTTANNIHLYISPSTSLLETTNVDDTQPNTLTNEMGKNSQDEETTDRPKEEPMDTSDAQVSIGSDGIIESHPTPVTNTETTENVKQKEVATSVTAKAFYSLSQPTNEKFEKLLAKLNTTSTDKTANNNSKETESNIKIQEEEELFIRETVSKILRRYSVKLDQNGRMISRELLTERVVEENTTTRVESWPPSDVKVRRTNAKAVRPIENTRKKQTKPITPKRKTKSLKPTSTVASPKKSKIVQSDDEEVSKNKKKNDDSSDSNKEDDKDDEDEETDDRPTDDVTGDEFIPLSDEFGEKSLKKGARIFAKWTDGHFYPGTVGNINGEKYTIDFDDGAKRHLKGQDIIVQNYLSPNQNVMAQTQDGYFERGVIKRIIKKKKTGTLGYVVEKDEKEKWYPLRFVSLTHEQAEHLTVAATITNSNKTTESITNIVQGKRKRTSNIPQSPNKKSKNSISLSPNKTQRSTYTPTRQTKLFNTMYFLFTGFNDSMDVRHQIEDLIDNRGGKIIEKFPNTNRHENTYLISDVPRKTAKFFGAKKLNIPCVHYDWINQSIEKAEIQNWETYKLVLPEKESKNNDENAAESKED